MENSRKKIITERLNELNKSIVNDTPVTVTKGLLINIIVKHMECNSRYKNYIAKAMNIQTMEELVQRLNTLDTKKLETLLLEI